MSFSGMAQPKRNLLQFSGIVVTSDSINPVPFTNVLIKHSGRGTVADFFGYFSIVAYESDTIEFSAMGFKKERFIIPDTLTASRYSLIQTLTSDTVLLPQTIIYPWPSKEQFKEAFVNFNVPDDDYERARKNLEKASIRYQSEVIPMDGVMNYRYAMDQQVNKLYYIGQTQPISLLNPFAWAQFIKAWKEGKFKKKN